MRRSTRPLLPGQRAVMGKKEVEIGQAIHDAAAELAEQWATYDVYLQVNTSDTNRERDEATLFVGREPHQIRSLAESGVIYNFDAKTKQLEIGLEDPVRRTGYEVDSVQPMTDHKLCLNCLDALN
jgi:hypothetical protein